MEYRLLNEIDIMRYRVDIIELLEEVYKINFSGYYPPLEELQNKTDDMIAYIKDGSAIIYGAIYDNKIIGILWAYYYNYLNKNRIHINVFVVNNRFQNAGVGKELLVMFEKDAFEQKNVDAIDLIVSATNEKAVNFYKKSDYSVERIKLKKHTI